MKAMYKIITDGNLRKEMIEKGLKRAKTFTWEKYTEGNLEVYKKILNYS